MFMLYGFANRWFNMKEIRRWRSHIYATANLGLILSIFLRTPKVHGVIVRNIRDFAYLTKRQNGDILIFF